MLKKEKIFYLDFIRAMAMLIIVTYHFNVNLMDNNINGLYLMRGRIWGKIGVTLFFMLSGAALMYNYDGNIDLKKYFKKRFLGIYPMFWIAYICVFLFIFYQNKSIVYNDMPIYKFLYSFFAMDGYLNSYTKTPYILGEWFIGCIIIIYILFPLYKLLLDKFPKVFFIISTLINFSLLFFYKNTKMPINRNLFVCSYSFILGMYLIKYMKNIKLWQMICSTITFIATYILFVKINSNSINAKVILVNIMGYNLFVILAYIGEKIKNEKIKKIFVFLGKYSYAIFLLHHYIIMKMESNFLNINLSALDTIALYLSCLIVIFICAKILYIINKKVIDFF